MVCSILEQCPSEPAVGQHAGQPPEGGRMRIRLKITKGLLASIRADLGRPHPFAYERVGFVLAAAAQSASDVLGLAREHRPGADENYLPDSSVAAMRGPVAISKALA